MTPETSDIPPTEMVTTAQLERSKAIQQQTGRTFHVATRFLPERVRDPTYVLYAFFRLADDVVDDADPSPPAAQRADLERLRAMALGERPPDDPVLAAFDELRVAHDIADEEIETFVDAMLADVEPDGYDTYAELETYLCGSAVAVAYMMLAVMDPVERERARPHAKALGEAFQLTNFLRDVREDVVEYDRVYLPRATLERYGVSTADVTALRNSTGVRAAIRHELERAETLYREGVAGIRHLPEDCQFPVLLSAVLYAEHHRQIRERGYDTVSSTPSLSTRRSLRLVARTWWNWRRDQDPEAVFYRVSAVDPLDAEETGGTSATVPDQPPADGGQRGSTGGLVARVTDLL